MVVLEMLLRGRRIAQHVGLILARRAWHGAVQVTMRELAGVTGWSARSCQLAIGELRAACLVRVLGEVGRANVIQWCADRVDSEYERLHPSSRERATPAAAPVVEGELRQPWIDAYRAAIGVSPHVLPRDWATLERYTREVTTRTGRDVAAVARATLEAWVGAPGVASLANERERDAGYPLTWLENAIGRLQLPVERRLSRVEKPAQALPRDRARGSEPRSFAGAAGIVAQLARGSV
jgi:hypothetical protein